MSPELQLTDPLGETLVSLDETALPAVLNDEEMVVSLDGSDPKGEVEIELGEFSDNLAVTMDEDDLKGISRKVIDWVEEDLKSREEWEQCLKNGMETLGIAPLSADDRPFKGASTVTHPLIAEAAVQFQSRAIEEFFPSVGPVKSKTIPNATQEVLDRGDRVEGFFNYYLTEEDEGYYDDSDKMLFVLALQGHTFRKTFMCPVTRMVKSRFVTASDLIVPYYATSLRDAPHYTHSFTMPLNDVERAVENGFYRDVDLKEGELQTPDLTESKKSADDSDRREPTGMEEGIPDLLECHCELLIESDTYNASGLARPYIVTVEKNTERVLSVYRNWDENDPRQLKEVWFASYKYLQGLGFYGLGLFHVLGNLAATAGASLRAIIDAAALNNLQGGFVAKQGGGRKLNLELEHGVWTEVDMTPEELKNAFYSPPFKEPSQTLMLTLRLLIESAQRFSSTTEAMVGEGSQSGPVGTTLALIEQGSKVFSAIHKRIHKAMAYELKNLAKMFKRHNVEYPYDVGPHSLSEDLDERIDVMPVSDPTIVSNTQRIAMAQAAQQLIRNDNTGLYTNKNRRMADLQLMKVMKVPNAEQLVAEYEEEKPPKLDPMTENMNLLKGKPIMAYEGQDHDAHISAHLNFFQALPPDGQKAVEQPGLAHIAEHAALKYQAIIQDAVKRTGLSVEQVAAQMTLPDLVPQMMPPPELPPEPPAQ